MGKITDTLNKKDIEFINNQKMFFVATTILGVVMRVRHTF